MVNKQMPHSRLHCNLSDSDKNILFFSLVDYRNNYFTSNEFDKIIEFYKGFENPDQLIQWMKERPKGSHTIHEVEGDKHIIVVIPTADFNGEFAKNCRENIFKGLYIIFVESGGLGDFYFNSAHNVNAGIRKAMEYNPKWIVFSGDDMYKIDDIKVLIKGLKEIDPTKYDVVFTQQSKYHSAPERIASPNILYKLYYHITNKNLGRDILKLQKKFNIKYGMCTTKGSFSHLFKKGYEYLEIQSFAIYSVNFANKSSGYIYDETFINAADDTDVSLKFSLTPFRIAKVNYKIGDYVGSTLGTGNDRALRTIAGLCYLNFKWSNIIDKFIGEDKNE